VKKLYIFCALVFVGCSSHPVAYQSGGPWPHFRADAVQDGRSDASPSRTGGSFWSFQTGKGIFSSPVVGSDGTIYVGSADRTFYALNRDGSLKWKLLTGEIIDSAALLDDRGRVYFGSGDGNLRALDAGSGAPVWTTPADPGNVNGGFINWFEGNVALAPNGSLYVPNDNHFVYAVDRDTGNFTQKLTLPDQTWSSPAFDGASHLFIGNNNVVSFEGSNLFAFTDTGVDTWDQFVGLGSVAASPMLTPGGPVIVGGFDGYVRAYDPASGMVTWEFGARDHIYSSPARLPDGTVVQAATDGTVYGLDEANGQQRWAFDIRDPIRSSPAVDGQGNVYFGAGDGRLYVLNHDGTLRWSVQLISLDRNDVNSSPALGEDAIYVGGESGEVFSIPYDYCLHADGMADPRCAPPSAPALPDDGAVLLYTTQFGATPPAPPASIDLNQPIVLSLVVRAGGHDTLARLDSSAVTVTVNPPLAVTVDVAGDGKFLTITPASSWVAGSDGNVAIDVSAGYLVMPQRDGLKLSGGTPGGNATLQLRAALNPRQPTPFALTPGTTWEVSRIALPLPTLLPSYNQIGFDSLQYLVSIVETGHGHTVAWMAGAKLAADSNQTVVDPATKALFPLDVTYDGGFVTMLNQAGVSVEVTNIVIPFQSFRLAAALGADGNASGPLYLNGSTVCSGIAVYGAFLQKLGLCNTADVLSVDGAANFNVFAGVAVPSAAQVGTVGFTGTKSSVVATLTGSALAANAHVAAVLLVDATTGAPVSLDYGLTTTRTAGADGNLSTVTLPLTGKTVPTSVVAYLMIDTSAVASATLTLQ
jgi:outer membrane protein assembly factor BamB